MRHIIAYTDYQTSIAAAKASVTLPDPVVLLHWLREKGVISAPYYLHIHQGQAEIGW